MLTDVATKPALILEQFYQCIYFLSFFFFGKNHLHILGFLTESSEDYKQGHFYTSITRAPRRCFDQRQLKNQRTSSCQVESA